MGIPFTDAFENLRYNKKRIRRQAWSNNGDVFLYLVPAASYPAQRGVAEAWFGAGSSVPYAEYFAYYDGTKVSMWQPTHEDLLAFDWEVIDV